jgi:hypothetical protein
LTNFTSHQDGDQLAHEVVYAPSSQGMTRLCGLADPAQMRAVFGDAPAATNAQPIAMTTDTATAERIAATIGRALVK